QPLVLSRGYLSYLRTITRHSYGAVPLPGTGSVGWSVVDFAYTPMLYQPGLGSNIVGSAYGPGPMLNPWWTSSQYTYGALSRLPSSGLKSAKDYLSGPPPIMIPFTFLKLQGFNIPIPIGRQMFTPTSTGRSRK